MKLHRIVASLLVAVLTVSVIRVPVYADETPEEEPIFVFVPGYAPSPTEDKYESVNKGRSADELFEVAERFYISPEASKIPSRCQDPYGTCWAFATMAAAEMSAVKHGVKLRDGSTANNKIDLSELHLAYFYGKYNEPYNPIGGFEGDINAVPDDDYLGSGGNPETAAQLLASWIGTADEKDYPYANDESLRKFSTARENAIDDVMHLKGFYYAEVDDDREGVKKLIKDYGAVASGYFNVSESEPEFKDIYSKENNCYYLPEARGLNHLISIVGWDDDFSRDKFAYSEKPEGDGAWLIRNSWEAGNYVASNGQLIGDEPERNSYFWISYYDKSLLRCYAFDMESADKYVHNYQYDGSIQSGLISGQQKFANIFTTSSDAPQMLTAVYFMTFDANVDYKIDVYTGVSPGEPESGIRAMTTQQGKTDYSGGHTIELTEPVKLEPGESFSVVVSVPEDISMGAEKTVKSMSYDTTAHTEGRRSLCFDGDSWKTANEVMGESIYGDFRIKAFTNWCSPVTGVSVLPNMSVKVNQYTQILYTVKPSYAGDKTVTWSSSDESVAYVTQMSGMDVIVPVKAGEADITVTTNDGGYTAACHVTVTDNNELTLIPGEVRRLSVIEGRYLYGLKWIVENASPKNCVSVKNGVVTAGNIPKGKTGHADVKVVSKGTTLSYKITVDGTVRENVPITEGGKKSQITAPKTLTLNVGTNGKAVVSIPSNLRDRAGKVSCIAEKAELCGFRKLSCSSNGSKATFEIIPKDAGATYLEWSLADADGNETKAYTKLIIKKPIAELQLHRADKLAVGKGELLKVTDTVGNTDPKDLAFSVKGKGIKVTKFGYVIATEPGAKGTITVKSGKVSSSIDVAADTPEEYLLLKQTSVTVAIPKPGAKAKTAAVSIAVPKKKQDQPNVTWKIDPQVPGVTINANGVVSVSSEASPGHYEIVATPSEENSGYNTATCELYVK
ncbi:MAG: Ig-like domain-containing protein [Lachnospiraceae bacterium]|nr:Ig-like domain-containing protein [Lachnospiraceae bacterium]